MRVRDGFGSMLGWAMLLTLLTIYGVGGLYAPYLLLLLIVVSIPYLLFMRGLRRPRLDLAGAGFLIAFALLALAFQLAAQKPDDVLIIANFIWLPLFVPMQGALQRLARPNAASIPMRARPSSAGWGRRTKMRYGTPTSVGSSAR